MEKRIAFAAVLMVPMALVGACGGRGANDETPGGAVADAAVIDRARLPAPIRVDAGCAVVIETPPLLASPHVSIGAEVAYSSNPPSSGPHYPIWAAYKTFATPVDRRYYVHNLEHGAIVLAYKCASANGCPEIVAGLEQAAAAIPTDATCFAPVRARVVITPDPLLDVPIAAAAWGWTYKAECLDSASLRDFALAHYGQGTEATCSDGQEQF